MTLEIKRKNTIGIIGVIFGMLALGMALLHFWAGPFDRYPALEEIVADKALSIKERVISKLKGDKTVVMAPKREYSKDNLVDIATISFGFLAIICAVISFIKREDKRASGSAVFLGIGAIGFQLLTVALGVIVVALLVAAVLSSLGLS
jgi:hypothetical protein